MSANQTYNEKELLLRIAEGDETAFRHLVKHYYNRLASYVLDITGSRQLMEEIVQDVMVKVWQKRAELAAVQRFDGWLFVIARNYTYDGLKKIARETKRREKWELEVLSATEENEITDEGSSLNRYTALLQEAIDQLPQQQRKIYLLSRREHLSSAAIQEQTGLSIDTIKKHRSQAVKNIKTYLNKYLSLFYF